MTATLDVGTWASVRTVELVEEATGAVSAVWVARRPIENIPEGARMVDLRTGYVVTAAGTLYGSYVIEYGDGGLGCSSAHEEFDVIGGIVGDGAR